ncbi:MAG: nitrate/nitrite transporter NrtS [Syntrophorhabdales bacterium]|jgi:hypothetical protein
MSRFFATAAEKETIATSAKVALFVGSILGLINYGDRIFVNGNMGAFDWVKLAVTYLVPYCVATYGAARHATRHAGEKEGDNPPGAS